MKKIAIIKQGGLSAGGIEKYLQQIAIELVKAGNLVDYFFTDAVPFETGGMHDGTDEKRKSLLQSYNIHLHEVKCDSLRALEQGGLWINSNFFELFNEKKYDVVIGGHKGEPNWPFSEISGKGPKIIETVHGTDFTSGTSQYADAYVLINSYQYPRWISRGGNKEKTHIISPMVSVDIPNSKNDRKLWNLPENKFIFGMHQSPRKGLFSHVPIEAYSRIANENNFFVILGGENEYEQQAKRLGLKNFLQLPSVSTSKEINSFLSCLDVYAHGRLDGEVCSSAIIEAMANNLPIVSHISNFNNGHISQLESCGIVVNSVSSYANAMLSYETNHLLRNEAIKATCEKYKQHFSFELCKNKLINLILSI